MVFTHESKIEDALQLSEGRYCVNFGFRVERPVSPDHTLKAARALLASGHEFAVASQAGVIVKAQELGVEFKDWGKLELF